MPTAMLSYCGRTLLEGLVRDLQVLQTLITSAVVSSPCTLSLSLSLSQSPGHTSHQDTSCLRIVHSLLHSNLRGEGMCTSPVPRACRQKSDDVQARESLYYKLYGVQYTTPVVIMTSDAKNNDALLRNLLHTFNWFGRGEENFRSPPPPYDRLPSEGTAYYVVRS
jgi:hypothetical protein